MMNIFRLALVWVCCCGALEAAPLNVKVFLSSEAHMGLGVVSAVVYGEKEAVLVDAQFTLSNAHRLAAEILELDRELTTIFVTHVHPDHFMGLPVIKQAFPNARVVSLPAVANDVNEAFAFKIDYWGKAVLGRNGGKTRVDVASLTEPVLLLEGERLEIIGPLQGDAANSAAVWVPSIKTLIAGDAVFADAHAWLSAAKTPELRQAWLDALDRLEALGPEVVVPGHAPSADLLQPGSIDFTRRYIEQFVAEMARTPDAAALAAAMKQHYPDASMDFCLDYSSRILKDKWTWDGQWPASLREMQAR